MFHINSVSLSGVSRVIQLSSKDTSYSHLCTSHIRLFHALIFFSSPPSLPPTGAPHLLLPLIISPECSLSFFNKLHFVHDCKYTCARLFPFLFVLKLFCTTKLVLFALPSSSYLLSLKAWCVRRGSRSFSPPWGHSLPSA